MKILFHQKIDSIEEGFEADISCSEILSNTEGVNNINIVEIHKKNRIHYILRFIGGEITTDAAVGLKSLSPEAAREVESMPN
ncbi:hypothetical protein AAHA92_21416 [Salvia divinorum]|uniref:Uncharacterized protein n=1 Tax=Salvia divinorum TaxID=28513 RepID=A0ABD1GNT2_SALDI